MTTEPTATPPLTPPPRRRWLQYSLRTRMLLVLIFGCGFGWLIHEWKRQRTQRILAALQAATRFEFIETPLKDAVDFLAAQHEIPIRIDEKSLREAGIKPDVPVTKYCRRTLNSALQRMLDELDLTYVVRDGVLLLTTADEAQRLVGRGAIGADEVQRRQSRDPDFQARHATLVGKLQELTRLEFIETPLADVLAYLRDFHDIDLEMDRRSMASAGVDEDVPCTFNMQDVTLEAALETIIVRRLGLTYVVEDEYILIAGPSEDE